MQRLVRTLAALAALVSCHQGADAALSEYSHPAARPEVPRLQLDEPALAPMAHVRFCLSYPQDCRVRRMAFRRDRIVLTPKRWAELAAINAAVNRQIVPERNAQGLAGEKWLLSPARGDCNDYAVTKRHALLARGWPSRSVLLAEVILNSGEHHLVVVMTTSEGDFIADNLTALILPWFKAHYRWVKIQSPRNPLFWFSVAG